MDVVIMEMAAHDLGRIGEIDRSEQVSVLYVHEHSELLAVDHELDIPTWSEEEIAASVRKLEPKLAVGGTLVGAIEAGRLVGIGVLGGSFLGERLDELEVAFLYVSSGHRRRGIATRLMDALAERARAKGAARLYISASDTGSAVRFYLGYGCEVAARVDPVLFALEPADIHMTFDLRPDAAATVD